MSRLLLYVMLPVLIVCALIASRFVSWDSLKGEDPEALQFVVKGTEFLGQQTDRDNRSAVAAFTRAIEISPKYAEAYIKCGLAHYRLGEYSKAIDDYTQTLSLNRYVADAYYSRGDAHRALGDYQHALVDYTASLKKRWAGFVTWKRAETYLEMGDTQRALADYGAVTERKPGAAAYYYRGVAYAQMEKNQLALADLDKAIEIEPAFAEAYLRRGEIYLRLNQPDAAESDYHKVVAFATDEIQGWGEGHPTLGLIYFRRASAYQQLTLYNEARADYEKIIALQPGSEIAQKAAGKLNIGTDN